MKESRSQKMLFFARFIASCPFDVVLFVCASPFIDVAANWECLSCVADVFLETSVPSKRTCTHYYLDKFVFVHGSMNDTNREV